MSQTAPAIDQSPVACTTHSQATTELGQYLARRPDATVFHDLRWARVFNRIYGMRTFYLGARRNGQIVGLLQLVLQKSLLFGAHFCSLPYFDACGILADDADVEAALLDHARELLALHGAKWVEVRQSSPLRKNLPLRDDKVAMRLDLPENSEEIWDSLKSQRRSEIRKAQAAGLHFRSGHGELLDEFYGIYFETMRELGSPQHSRAFFEAIIDELGPCVRLFEAGTEGCTMAAALGLEGPGGIHITWAGSHWRYRHTNANAFLYWNMIRECCDRGLKCFDFGRSTRGSGTYAFKHKWGAKEAVLNWYYLLAPGQQPPALRSDNPRYQRLQSWWQKLPRPMVKILGPRVIRGLS